MYTAMSFAPVQGFIEKSRKLRDLYGASLILSYLSGRLIKFAKQALGPESLISPALIDNQKGTPNRILVKGDLSQADIAQALSDAWGTILDTCQKWIEKHVPSSVTYSEWHEEWRHWRRYSWEVFWGQGNSAIAAMDDLETRKLQRNWVAINWVGESSSLSGADAIAWPGLGSDAMRPQKDNQQKIVGNPNHRSHYEAFYRQLAWSATHPGQIAPTDQAAHGGFIAESERLSIPELTKRLVTLPQLAQQLGIDFPETFRDIRREPGCWTAWFMGDGDKVGEHLKAIAQSPTGAERALQQFSHAMSEWGGRFEQNFPLDLGRVVYAGGDDFLGVLYREESEPDSQSTVAPLSPQQALEWLYGLPAQWQTHQQPINLSLGFVWAGHQVPQRDILQHCREAEQRSKYLGRDRITIRILFNSGQYVQWTCPWTYLEVLKLYRDRDGGNNWAHIYKDWAHLKARHAIPADLNIDELDERIALSLVNLYFDRDGQHQRQYGEEMKSYLSAQAKDITGSTAASELIQWIDGLINIGWQLCSNS
ncbi:CRISPR-associated protein Cmr2 [filamentous cyanobacterium LEGE 11480]|uniref:CRISPR-associated protein Cmr2 n=1 Tax=Romeriopsis navalis LEGE 11480 TaxID=2777977 RepID=A0A928VW42_9CYAN|nr:type III-B CRISPR-associated protein Cas10/Cmr2 [Romeriopsis navalis]MBE9033129.1 CRISPR-associated protein Cmr2 [Romeriopsis navalis LEGE 11480]